MNQYYTVGELSKYTGIPKQTLRYYGELGIFKPDIINKENGYRYYSLTQFLKIRRITELKELGLSLKEIKNIVDNQSLDTNLEMLEMQNKIIDEKIRKLNGIKEKIEYDANLIRDYEYYRKLNKKIQIKELPERYFLRADTKVEIPLEVEKYINRIKGGVKKGSMVSTGNALVCSDYNARLKGELKLVAAGYICDKKYDREDIRILPEGKYLTSYYVGHYKEMEDLYKMFIDHVKNNNYEVLSDFLEIQLLGFINTNYTDEYLTEIQLLVK